MTVVERFATVVLGLLLLGVTSALAADSATAKLAPQNNSGESGTATLTKAGDNQTKVVLDVKGAPSGAAQPVHIHKGTCDTLDPKPTYARQWQVGVDGQRLARQSRQGRLRHQRPQVRPGSLHVRLLRRDRVDVRSSRRDDKGLTALAP